MGITWLASYPRSGNTWMRLLLHHALHDDLAATADLQASIPDIHRAPLPEGTALAKTHFLWSSDHPRAAQTDAHIQLVRDPRDVLKSSVQYALLTGLGDDPRALARQFIDAGGLTAWIDAGFGSWTQHLESWTRRQGPALTIRYEDLVEDPQRELARALDLLSADPVRPLPQVVERCSMARLRAMEDREKAEGRCWFPGSQGQLNKGLRFFGSERPWTDLDDIQPGLEDAFNRAFSHAAAGAGY